MKIGKALKIYAASRLHKFMATNAAWDWSSSTDRNRPPTELKSTDDALDFGSREEMLSEARSLCQVFGRSSSHRLSVRELHGRDVRSGLGNGQSRVGSAGARILERSHEAHRRARQNDLPQYGQARCQDSNCEKATSGSERLRKQVFRSSSHYEPDRIRTSAFKGGPDFLEGFVGGIRVNANGAIERL